jgi:hypothetical protein
MAERMWQRDISGFLNVTRTFPGSKQKKAVHAIGTLLLPEAPA